MRKDYILEIKSSSDCSYPDLIYQNSSSCSSSSAQTPSHQHVITSACNHLPSALKTATFPNEKYVKFSIRNSNNKKTISQTITKLLIVFILSVLVYFNISSLDPIQKILLKNDISPPTAKNEKQEIAIRIVLNVLKQLSYILAAIRISSWFHHETDFEIEESLLIIPQVGFQHESVTKRITVLGLLTSLIFKLIQTALQVIGSVQIGERGLRKQQQKQLKTSCYSNDGIGLNAWISILENLAIGNVSDTNFQSCVTKIISGNTNNMKKKKTNKKKLQKFIIEQLYTQQTTERDFFPIELIKDLIIHEGFKEFGVEFYLALIVNEPISNDTSANRKENLKMVVMFQKLLPRRKLLETVWRRSRKYLN